MMARMSLRTAIACLITGVLVATSGLGLKASATAPEPATTPAATRQARAVRRDMGDIIRGELKVRTNDGRARGSDRDTVDLKVHGYDCEAS